MWSYFKNYIFNSSVNDAGEFCRLNGYSKEVEDYISQTYINLLFEIGKIDRGILEQSLNRQDFLELSKNKNQNIKEKRIGNFIGSSKARYYFCNYKPKNDYEEGYFSMIEESIKIVQEYFDSLKNPKLGGLINMSIRDYGGFQEGIKVKEVPYQFDKYVFNVVGIDGGFVTEKKSDGSVESEIDEGKIFGLIVRTDHWPSKDELIDYLCGKFWLEQKEPKLQYRDDFGLKNIYFQPKEIW